MAVDREFTVVGELTDDCRYIEVSHYKPLKRLINHLIGKPLEVVFKPLRYKRSEAQNRWLWGVAYTTVAGWYKDTTGERIDKEVIHSYTKQVLMGGDKEVNLVALSHEDFMNLISEILDLNFPKEKILDIVGRSSRNWVVNMQVEEVLGKRVLVDSSLKSTKALNTKEFSELKDLLQAHWAEKGCDIPDPKENNLLSDYIEDE